MSITLSLWTQLYLYPLIMTFVLWSGLTVGLLWLNRRGSATARWVLLLTIPLLFGAHQQLWHTRYDLSAAGAYLSFAAGMLIWTWHELAFYSGVLTGPWRAPCPPDATGWRRFKYALGTHLYHEAGVLIEFGILCWLYRGADNWIGLITFVLLWALQHSAKLNVLLGVRSLHVELLPEHLRYLGSFWRQRPYNSFFLPSVLVISVLAVALWSRAIGLDEPGASIGMVLLATLTTLGVLEHWLLVLPAGHSHQSNVKKRPKADISHLNTDS